MNRKEALEKVWARVQVNLEEGKETQINENRHEKYFNVISLHERCIGNSNEWIHYEPERVAPKKGRIVKNPNNGKLYFSLSSFDKHGNLICSEFDEPHSGGTYHFLLDWQELPGQDEMVKTVTSICFKCKRENIRRDHEPCLSCQSTIPTNFEAKDE